MSTLSIYTKWLATATAEEKQFAQQVYDLCEKNYGKGGDIVVETFHPSEVVRYFKTLNDVREYIGLKLEQATNCREGNDNDPELRALHEFEENWDG